MRFIDKFNTNYQRIKRLVFNRVDSVIVLIPNYFIYQNIF